MLEHVQESAPVLADNLGFFQSHECPELLGPFIRAVHAQLHQKPDPECLRFLKNVCGRIGSICLLGLLISFSNLIFLSC